jgi:hypothetical protein
MSIVVHANIFTANENLYMLILSLIRSGLTFLYVKADFLRKSIFKDTSFNKMYFLSLYLESAVVRRKSEDHIKGTSTCIYNTRPISKIKCILTSDMTTRKSLMHVSTL